MNTIINISLSPTITNQKHTRGGITGRHFHPWKPQFLAPVSKNCFLKGWKTCSKSSWFLENHVFTLTCSLAFAVAWQSFSARSLCCERHCHCRTLATKSLLILPLFLVWMPGESYLCFSSTCNRFHLCAPTRLALGLVASSREDLVNVASRSFASAREDPVNVASKSLTCKRRFC